MGLLVSGGHASHSTSIANMATITQLEHDKWEDPFRGGPFSGAPLGSTVSIPPLSQDDAGKPLTS